MIMADVFAVFGTLLALGIALPGLLLTWRLLLPTVTQRTQERLSRTPWQCFFMGAALIGMALIPILILFNLPWGGFRAIAAIASFLIITIASLGAAGLAGLMGERLQHFGFASSTIGATVRGAIALELAAVFPLIGWFIFIPLTFITVLGASIFALLGWQPRSEASAPPASRGNEDVTVLQQRLVTEE